jgi:hypothetical protein
VDVDAGRTSWISFHQHGISLTRVSDAAEFRDNLHSACAIGHLVLFLFVAEIPGEGGCMTWKRKPGGS